ncbi:MAG: SIMPL domain-containing protein [Clostridiales bacterium]|nr:SIMPL domain-containing protein [Clostridiales bacterium]
MEENRVRAGFAWIAALIFMIGIIGAASVVTYGLIRTRTQPNLITVTGSAKKQITSDYVTWRGSFSRQSSSLPEAYDQLQADLKTVKAYLADRGFDEKDYTVSSINTIVNNVVLPSGMYSSEIDSYRLYQDIDIASTEVDKVTSLSRESTELIQKGVQFQSNSPMYFYTKIADLKVDMLALATKDARSRADKIAENAGSTLGKLKTAKMGVFQITPINSNDISDYGINDTSSIEKEIMSVVSCTFYAK